MSKKLSFAALLLQNHSYITHALHFRCNLAAIVKSGVTEEIEIEVYSNAGDTAAGILGLAVIGGGVLLGIAEEKRRKRLKQNEIRTKDAIIETLFQSKNYRESKTSS